MYIEMQCKYLDCCAELGLLRAYIIHGMCTQCLDEKAKIIRTK